MNATTDATKSRVAGATAALDRFLSQHGGDRARPALRYLRRKPGRGLVAVFGGASDPGNTYTVTVDESWVSRLPDLLGEHPDGVTVQRFPNDPQLPHLAAVMAPSASGPVAAALESAVRRARGVAADWVLMSLDAEPLRYKPGDRCVIRYRLRFGQQDAHEERTRTHTVVAKLYREQGEAQAADELLSRLHAQAGVTWSARPLGVVADLPLALTEDLGSSRDDVPALSGLHLVRPASDTAFDVIRSAARALAELHTSNVDTRDLDRRTGADEVAKAAKRVKALEQYVPALAPVTRRVADRLSEALTRLPDSDLRPAHGSYKPSQLLVRGGDVFLVDFDQFCLADPALDVGYFMAYLRPSGLWYRRAGTRAWFEAAANVFLSAYSQHLVERGVSADTCSGIVARSHVFEAALLLKIAARRPNRLHSPRPGEVAAVLDEISTSLDRAEGLGAPVSR
jgi:hypothetical protein